MEFSAPLDHEFYLKGLDHCIMVVRASFETACDAKPSVSSGMHWLLENSEAALAIKTNTPFKKLPPEMAEAAGICWRLGNSMLTLMDRRIAFDEHLKMMRKGDAQYGQKDPQGRERFKDFELELLVTAKLCDLSTRAVELKPPGDPFDITLSNKLQIECKHPTSEGGMAGAITDFGKELDATNQKGAIVFAIEDVLELSKMPIVGTPAELTAYVNARCEAVLSPKTKGWILNFEAHPNILGIYFMASVPTYFSEGCSTDFLLQIVTQVGPTRSSGSRETDALFREFLTALQ